MGRLKDHLTDEVRCPTCGAKPGQPCLAPLSRTRRLRMQRDNPAASPPVMAEVRWLHRARQP